MLDCNKINIRKESKGNDVKELQTYLTFRGYYDGKIDGSCGDYTVSAIKKLQKAVGGLVVDGIFGPLTCKVSGINGRDISGTSQTIDLDIWKNMMTRYDTYIKENGREPKFVYINKTQITQPNTTTNKPSTNTIITYFSSTPHYTSQGCNRLGQCTPYYCGVHSLHQVLRKFGITDYSESTLAA